MKKKLPIGEHMFAGLSRSICPECNKMVNAQMLIRGDHVVMRKYCSEHGHTEVTVTEDVDWLFSSRRALKPPDVPMAFGANVEKGCPEDCGLCPDHQQHTCFAQVEITNVCDLNCPVCFEGNKKDKPWYLSLTQFENMLDKAVERENGLNLINITGGETTMHPQIIDLIKAAKRRKIGGVLLATNGLRIAKDEEFVRELADSRPTIYLSFDGFNRDVYKKLRGRDLLDIKLKALEMLERYNITTTLVPTIVKGVNDDQLGPVVDYMLKSKNIHVIQFQPVSYVGSAAEMEHTVEDRLTVTGVMDKVETQTNALIKKSDFMHIPCHNPLCGTTCYIFLDEQNNPQPLKRFVDVDKYLDYITNRPQAETSDLFDLSRDAVENIASASAILGKSDGAVEQSITRLMSNTNCCGIDPKGFHRRMKQINIHAFMDAHSYDQARVQKCCVHILLPDGRMIPSCNYNLFHRHTGNPNSYEYLIDKTKEGEVA